MAGKRRSIQAIRKITPMAAVPGRKLGASRRERGPGGRLLDPSRELEVCIALHTRM